MRNKKVFLVATLHTNIENFSKFMKLKKKCKILRIFQTFKILEINEFCKLYLTTIPKFGMKSHSVYFNMNLGKFGKFMINFLLTKNFEIL